MKQQRRHNRHRRAVHHRIVGAEALETRELLATTTETFTGPSLTDLIQLARQGQNTAPAAIDRMVQSLRTQLTHGPLADLNSGAVNGNGFVTEVQNLEGSYEQNLDQQLLPSFPNVDQMLKLQGQRIVADVVSLNQQESVGLLSSTNAASDSQTAINSLTQGPIYSLDTSLSGYAGATATFEVGLNTLAQSLNSSAASPLTPSQVSTTLLSEAEAYRTNMHAGLQVQHPNISNMVDLAVNSLESTALSLALSTSSQAQSQLTGAIKAFDAAILGQTGAFGPNGVVSRAGTDFTPNQTIPQASTSIGNVSGTASLGGTATLTATVTTSSVGQGISGVAVSFTLDGAFAGVAMTDSSGVATLTGVQTSNLPGTDTDGIVASFAGTINNKPAYANGPLTVSQAATSLTKVSGTASGGTATLTATLTSSVTNQGIAGETVSFSLGGTSVGTASTGSNGIATLSGITTSDPTGTAVGVSFAGDANYTSSQGTGTLTNNG